MTEYLLVVALVSLMAGGVTSRVADQVRLKFGLAATALGGKAPTGAILSAHRYDLKAMTPANLKHLHFED